MSDKRAKYTSVLKKYVPLEYVDLVTDLLLKYRVVFKIVKPRKTKLGDFRAGIQGEKHQITVNGDLNKYSFLITTLHEFAHLITYDEYGRRAAPHGKEWKDNFSMLLVPMIRIGHLPKPIESALMNSLVNVKASSCTDVNLQRVLLTFDERNDNLTTLESLEKNSIFELNGRLFEKGVLRRTRFMCKEQHGKRYFLVNRLAMVKEFKNEQE
jgi:SprT protein